MVPGTAWFQEYCPLGLAVALENGEFIFSHCIFLPLYILQSFPSRTPFVIILKSNCKTTLLT